MCRRGQNMLCPLLRKIFFYSKLLLDNSASFTSSRTNDLCQKWKVKLFFSRRALTACQEQGLLSVDVNHWRRPNLIQFDGWTWRTLTRQYFTTDLYATEAKLRRQSCFLFACHEDSSTRAWINILRVNITGSVHEEENPVLNDKITPHFITRNWKRLC